MSGLQKASKAKGNADGSPAHHQVSPPPSSTKVDPKKSAGQSEALPPLYWSVLHHKNLHEESPAAKVGAASHRKNDVSSKGKPTEVIVPAVIRDHERQPLISEVSERSVISGFGSTSESPPVSRQPTMPEPTAGGRMSGWGKVREVVHSQELLIRHIPDQDGGNAAEVLMSDLNISSYELTLRECLFLFIALLAIGVLAYSFGFEHWTILDALYFTTVLLTTVGYGDMTPTTPGGKLFGSVFALAGIVLLGLALGVVGSQLVEAEINYTKKMQNRTTRVLEKTFTRRGSRHRVASTTHRDSDIMDGSLSRSDSNSSLDSLDSVASDSTCGSVYDPESATERSISSNPPTRRRRRKRKTPKRFEGLLVIWRYLPGTLPIIISCLALSLLERWSWYDSIYYCVVTATTIGFGDLTPHAEISKAAAILFVPIAVASMGYILGNVASFIVEHRRAEAVARLWSDELKLEDIEALDEAHDGGVSELEYIKFMLVAMKKIDGNLFDDLREQFLEMDLTGDGQITKSDLKLMAARKMKRVGHKLKLRAYKKQLQQQRSATFGITDAIRKMSLQPTRLRQVCKPTDHRRSFERKSTAPSENLHGNSEQGDRPIDKLQDFQDRTTEVVGNH